MSITMIVLIICIANFLWIHFGSGNDQIYKYTLIPMQVKRGQWYRLITSGFLHVQPWHLIMNMYSLYSLGSYMESMFGSFWYSIILFGSIIGGSLVTTFFGDDGTSTIGISGGLYGLMGAYLFLLVRSGSLSNPYVLTSVLRMCIANLIINFMPNISRTGHLGGLITGILLAVLRIYVF